MIKVLGMKRIIVLIVLVAVNVALAAGLYLSLEPLTVKKQRELKGIRSKISSVSADISKLQVEFSQLEAQKAEFEDLKEHGFFSDQGRRQAEKIFGQIQKQSRVVSATAVVQPGTIEENEEAQKSEHKILASPINITIEAIDDVDIFRYLYLVEHFFPGHISFDRIKLERKAEVTGPILRAVASGDEPRLVKAEVSLSWRTMIPQKEILKGASE